MDHAASCSRTDLFLDALQNQRESATLLMMLCMPQVFFYGIFVLVGQILNARGRFGPMMWAPIANNVFACAVILTYFVLFGASNEGDGFTTGEAVLLGLGSTVAIALQALILIPYLRQAGFRYRPRFDFRGVGLGHTFKLGLWTLAVHRWSTRSRTSWSPGSRPEPTSRARSTASPLPAWRSTTWASWSASCRTVSSRCRWPPRSSRRWPAWPPRGATTGSGSSWAARCAWRW